MSEKEVHGTSLSPEDVASNEEGLEERGIAPEEYSNLPPVDTGKAAWLFLAAAFVVEVLTIGKFTRASADCDLLY
jgi:hypothetical protein